MSIELVTGHAGAAHVTSAQDGRLNAAAWGAGKYVLPLQARFAITVDSTNQVTVATGDAMMEGRHITSEAPTVLSVASGTQGMRRNDIVAVVYSKDGAGVETAALAVVQGAESAGAPSDPALPSGSVLAGDPTCAMALWRLPIDGISLGDPEPLFSVAGELSADENYAYSLGYNASTLRLTLTGANGGTTTFAPLPTATTSAYGMVKVGTGVSVSGGTISVPTATASRNGLMTTSQVSTLNRLATGSSTYSGGLMGFGYQNASGAVYMFFPVNAAGRTSAAISGMADPVCIGAGGRVTFSGFSKPSAGTLVNGGTLLQVSFSAMERPELPHYHAFTAWLSSVTVTFS